LSALRGLLAGWALELAALMCGSLSVSSGDDRGLLAGSMR
jgi:hypothetical protein